MKKLVNLTYPQKAIWMIEQFYPNTNINCLGGCSKILEEIDIPRLQKAFNIFLQKNDGLRLRFFVENNEPLSSQILNDIYLELVKKYHGKEVKVFDCCKFEWSRIPHFYSAFYVYKYATGLISAINIVENLKEGIISVDDYKKFLSSGCTNDPVSLLKIVKVDLTKKESFEKAFAVLERYLNHFENLI